MKSLMSWEECLSKHVKIVDVDLDKIISMRKMSSVRLRVLKNVVLDDETASILATDYYEVIKELLVAILLKNGLKSNNHECLISFFKNKFAKYDYEVSIIHSLKHVRNRVSYDGFFVKKEYIVMNQLEFIHIIELLDSLLD